MKQYRSIYIDPPWDMGMTGLYKTRALRPASLVYPTMTLAEIAALPVPQLAEPNCHLYLWVTNKFLAEGLELMKGWGFRYLAPLVWIKPSGLGNYWVSRTEFLLMGYSGKCLFKRRYKPNVYFEPRARKGEHSRKPESFAKLIEECSFGPYLEMFARREREGWDVWGNDEQVVGSERFVEAGGSCKERD